MKKERLSVNGCTLKWIAIITMLIDHIAAVCIDSYFLVFQGSRQKYQTLLDIYTMMRTIGRLSFPIFIFLLVEGIRHTSNIRKYGTRLLCFALISEIPFNYAISGTFFIPGKACNVFFTLFLGFLAIVCIRMILKSQDFITLRVVMAAVIAGFSMAAAEYLNTDYGMYGVATIILMYFLPLYVPAGNRQIAFVLSLIPLIVLSTTEAWALLDVILIAKYDGTRGKQMKYFFYIFYPAHLLILGLITHYFIQ